MDLVFVHGRSQHGKDADSLRTAWIAALQTGLRAAGMLLPIPEDHIRFPYYGNTLDNLVRGLAPNQIARVVVAGGSSDRNEPEIELALLDDIRRAAGVSDEEISEMLAATNSDRGGQDWR